MTDGLSAKATRSPSATDGVSVSIEVDVTPAVAFDVFTQEMDGWWARGPRFRFLAPYAGTMTLEPRIGGRLLHVADAGREFVVGEVHVCSEASGGATCSAPSSGTRRPADPTIEPKEASDEHGEQRTQ